MNKFVKTICVGMLLLTANSLVAGDFEDSRFNHRIVSLNSGYVFSGSGDCWGISNEISHLKSITSWLFHKESIEGWIINGKSWIDGGFENQTGVNFTADIGIAPFRTGNRIFYLAGGGIIGFLSNISPNGGSSLHYTSNGVTQTFNKALYSAEGYFTPGFSLSAGYITKVNSKIYLNIRAQTKVYNSGEVLSTLSIGIGLNALK